MNNNDQQWDLSVKFETKKIKWSDDDLKAMENMSLEEKIEFKRKLKAKNRYTYE